MHTCYFCHKEGVGLLLVPVDTDMQYVSVGAPAHARCWRKRHTIPNTIIVGGFFWLLFFCLNFCEGLNSTKTDWWLALGLAIISTIGSWWMFSHDHWDWEKHTSNQGSS